MRIDLPFPQSHNRGMKNILKLIQLDFVPRSADLALLVLRVWLGLTLLLNHGLDKLLTFSEKSAHFPDPLGVGHTFSLGLAVFGEVVGSALLVVGLLGRFAAISVIILMSVAFIFVHQHALSGEHSGELAFVYLAGAVALYLAGPGRFSIDQFLFAKGAAPKGE
jgi:putative oxidoreductase